MTCNLEHSSVALSQHLIFSPSEWHQRKMAIMWLWSIVLTQVLFLRGVCIVMLFLFLIFSPPHQSGRQFSWPGLPCWITLHCILAKAEPGSTFCWTTRSFLKWPSAPALRQHNALTKNNEKALFGECSSNVYLNTALPPNFLIFPQISIRLGAPLSWTRVKVPAWVPLLHITPPLLPCFLSRSWAILSIKPEKAKKIY